MKIESEKFFIKSLSFALMMFGVFSVNNDVNAASRLAVRNTPSTRKTITTRPAVTNTNTQTQPETQVPEPEPEPVVVEPEPEPEPTIIENKSNQFDSVLSEAGASSRDATITNMAELIKKQRAAYEANENTAYTQQQQQQALATGKNACDSGLRKCMSETCGANFTKCALDGDTIFGDKLNKCRRETTCTGEEFKLFTTEIKADRDFNVQMASYTSVIECGNSYNSCIQTECGATFNKCLGKTAEDKAIKKCATIAKNCTEQDSGLSSRMGVVIGKLRENAEKDVKTDEKRLYELRDLMRKQCEHLGAMFDERTFDCVYTINFFAGENQSSPTASRKAYAGSSFVCTQEWFGINATTFKENAYRETRAQTGASAAMLGSGLGTAAGLITSGAIDRALDTQNAKKALKDECKSQGGKLKNGECVLPEDEEDKTVNRNNPPENVSDCKYKGTPGKSCKNVIPDRTHVQKAVYDESGCCVVSCNKGYTRTDDDTCVPNTEHQEQQAQGRDLQKQVITEKNVQEGLGVVNTGIRELGSTSRQLIDGAAKVGEGAMDAAGNAAGTVATVGALL